MGFFNAIKDVFGNKAEITVRESTDSLLIAQENIKQAHEELSKFLQDSRDFKPAKRHEILYNENVKGKVALIRSWLGRAIYFLDGRITNNFVGVEGINGVEQLSNMVGTWVRVLKHEEEKQPENNLDLKGMYTTYADVKINQPSSEEKQPDDIIGTLKIEMWSEERRKRGFPVPENKHILLGYLDNAFRKLKDAKNNLTEHSVSNL